MSPVKQVLPRLRVREVAIEEVLKVFDGAAQVPYRRKDSPSGRRGGRSRGGATDKGGGKEEKNEGYHLALATCFSNQQSYRFFVYASIRTYLPAPASFRWSATPPCRQG